MSGQLAAGFDRVVITGAAGRLGTAVTAALEDRGFEVIGIDRLPPAQDRAGFVVAELADREAVQAALRPDDLILHVASIHGFSGQYGGAPDDVYFDLNVKGTWSLYQAAEGAGVRKVVLTSTVGSAGFPLPPLTQILVDDRYPATEIYSLTKRIQEDIAEGFGHHSPGVSTLALRPPGFVEFEGARQGRFIVTGFLTLPDIVAAHVAAVVAASDGRVMTAPGLEKLFVTNQLPFVAEDFLSGDIRADFLTAIDKHWPGAATWLDERDALPDRLPTFYDNSATAERIGWQPVYTFTEWYAENRAVL